MVLMAAAADDDHARHRIIANPASPPSPSPAPAPLPPNPHPHPHRRRLHSFSFPTLSWGTHRLLRCSKNPASSPPPAAPDTPSPDKENARPPADAAAGSPHRAPQRPWNLRTRRSATAAPRAPGPDDGAAADAYAAPDRAPPAARHPAEPSKRGFSVLLSKEEIADDFALFRGTRPPRRPKKRPRTLQRQIDSLCPGFCLADVTPETYRIEER